MSTSQMSTSQMSTSQPGGRLVVAELLKIRTTRAGWILPLVAVAASLVFPIGSMFRAEGMAPATQETALVVSTLVVAMVAVGMAALAVTSEHRHRTVIPTALAAPGRVRVLAAKYAAAALVTVATAVASIAVTVITVAVLAAGTGEPIAIGDDVVTVAPAAVAGLVLWASAGVALGSAIRNSAGALVAIYLGWAILPMLAAAVSPVLVPWVQPVDAVGAVAGFGEMGLAQALATLGLWIAAPAAAGLLALRNDIG